MSFVNPVDVVSYMDSFDTDKAVNARNKAKTFAKASAAMSRRKWLEQLLKCSEKQRS